MANVYRFWKDVYGDGAGVDSYAISGGTASTSSISQGDLMQWDPTARYATNAVMVSGSIFLGVCEEANPLAGLGTTSAPLTGGKVRIKSTGIHNMKATSGETYSHLDPVFPDDTDVQTVTLANDTRIIGRVWLPDGTQVTGTGSNTVPVLILGSMTNNSVVPSSAAAAK